MKRAALSALINFPLAALFNSFSMTALMLVLGVAGWYEVVADIGLVQGVTLALFYGFSANARNLILADANGFMATRLLQSRLILLLPLASVAYYLSVYVGMVSVSLAVVLIVRRMSEWIGEIGHAMHERMNQTEFARQVLVLECITLILTLLFLWFGLDLAFSMIPWALVPLLATRRAKLLWRLKEGRINFQALLPHFGSTAIVGISIYIFRFSIVSLTGKTIAGELFTAFAIGGLIPTIIGQAFAPTLVQRFSASSLNRWLLFVSVPAFSLAVVLIALAVDPTQWVLALGHSRVFWLAVGFSIAGGAIMSHAVVMRTRLAQEEEGSSVFGSDLLANVLVVASVPFFHQVIGPDSLAGMYALSSCLCLIFLRGAGQRQSLNTPYLMPVLLWIGGLLIFPIFFLIDTGLFRDPSFIFDTCGTISCLPIPISVLALFGGIALLGNYVAAIRTLTVVFLTLLLFVATFFITAQGSSMYYGIKLILLAQFLLPIFGLILGQMYGSATQEPIFERVALWILLLVVLAQLAATWLQGNTAMSSMIFVFSIYQHLEYYPMIVAALVTMASLALWNQGIVARMVLTILMPAAMVQIIGSMSIMAIFGLIFGLTGFAFAHLRKGKSRRWATSMLVATLLCGVAYGVANVPGALQSWLNPADKPVFNMQWPDTPSSVYSPEGDILSKKVSSRLDSWRYYADGVVESPQAFLFGRESHPDRNLYPSAHNYWLDVLYNFGALALLPLIILLLETLRSLWWRRTDILANPVLLGTVMAVVYLLLGESMISTGMRQPYSGIITFFVWGLLITRLRPTATEKTIAGEGIRS